MENTQFTKILRKISGFRIKQDEKEDLHYYDFKSYKISNRKEKWIGIKFPFGGKKHYFKSKEKLIFNEFRFKEWFTTTTNDRFDDFIFHETILVLLLILKLSL